MPIHHSVGDHVEYTAKAKRILAPSDPDAIGEVIDVASATGEPLVRWPFGLSWELVGDVRKVER